jgi:predicted transcriptional regulator
MTPHVVSVAEDTPLSEVAALFERKRIKRVPITRDGKLVGIVSRSNLVQALASVIGRGAEPPDSDRQIRLELLSRLGRPAGR